MGLSDCGTAAQETVGSSRSSNLEYVCEVHGPIDPLSRCPIVPHSYSLNAIWSIPFDGRTSPAPSEAFQREN